MMILLGIFSALFTAGVLMYLIMTVTVWVIERVGLAVWTAYCVSIFLPSIAGMILLAILIFVTVSGVKP